MKKAPINKDGVFYGKESNSTGAWNALLRALGIDMEKEDFTR